MRHIRRISWRAVVASSLLASATAAPAAAQSPFSTVALSGRPAPGTPAGVEYVSFGAPLLNNSGDVAFGATLYDTVTWAYGDNAIYAGRLASPVLVARTGQPAPGGGVFSGEFSGLTLNNIGQVAFSVGYGHWGNDSIYAGSPSSLSLVARQGSPAPGMGAIYRGLSDPVLNNAGQVAFTAATDQSGYSQTIYAGPPGAPAPVASTGNPAPGMPAGVHYEKGYFNVWGYEWGEGPPLVRPFLNDAGQVAFSIGSGGVAVYVGAPGSLTQVAARTADPAPGVYEHLYPISLNNAGQVTFVGVTGGDADSTRTIYAGSPGSVVQVAREGNPAPGTPEGVRYGGIDNRIDNDAGQVAFAAALEGTGVTGANFRAIFSGPFSSPSLVARAGSPAPGTPAGVTYTTLSFGEHFGSVVALNDTGQIAFLAPLAGPGVSEASDVGLYFYDPVLSTRLVVREGDLFDLGGGDRRQIQSIGFHKDFDDGSAAGLSDDGRLAFSLTFTDGSSGVFVATVPEPASGAVCLGAAGLLLLRRRVA